MCVLEFSSVSLEFATEKASVPGATALEPTGGVAGLKFLEFEVAKVLAKVADQWNPNPAARPRTVIKEAAMAPRIKTAATTETALLCERIFFEDKG
jgi:hypothetical protein